MGIIWEIKNEIRRARFLRKFHAETDAARKAARRDYYAPELRRPRELSAEEAVWLDRDGWLVNRFRLDYKQSYATGFALSTLSLEGHCQFPELDSRYFAALWAEMRRTAAAAAQNEVSEEEAFALGSRRHAHGGLRDFCRYEQCYATDSALFSINLYADRDPGETPRRFLLDLWAATTKTVRGFGLPGPEGRHDDFADIAGDPAAKAAQPEAPRMLGDFEHAAAPQRDRDGVGSGRPVDVELVEEPGFDEGLLLGGEAVVERVVVDDRAAADARKDGVCVLIHAEDSTKDRPGHASGQN